MTFARFKSFVEVSFRPRKMITVSVKLVTLSLLYLEQTNFVIYSYMQNRRYRC